MKATRPISASAITPRTIHKRMKEVWIFLFCLLPAAASWGQPVQTSEKNVFQEQQFIEAKLQALLGNYAKAKDLLRELVKTDPENAAASFELARVYDQLGDKDEAVRWARKAAELETKNTWYKEFLGGIYEESGRFREAADLFEQLVSQKPSEDYYYYKWAFYLVSAGEPAKAIKVYDQLEKRIGVQEDLATRKYRVYLGLGDEKKAGKELIRLVETYPDETEYLHLLASFYEQTQQKGDAKEVYQQILKIDPYDSKATVALAESNKGKSDDMNYLRSLQAVMTNPSVALDDKVQQLIPYVEQLSQKEDPELSAALIDLSTQLLQQHPQQAKPHALLADVLYFSGQKEEAIGEYKKAIELDDTVYLVWEQLLYLLLEKRAYDDLSQQAEKALDIYPNQASLYYLYGAGLNGLGKTDDAIYHLDQVMFMARKNVFLQVQALSQLGAAYAKQNQAVKAEQAFQQALQAEAENPFVLSAYSYALSTMGKDPDRAKSLSEQALEISPGHPVFLTHYGWVFYQQKNYQEAEKWIKKAIENKGDQDAFILERYGDVLFQNGLVDQALRYWRQASEKGYASELLQKKIADKQLYE
jgi:tetratricopeptide (TPR) repeat protein